MKKAMMKVASIECYVVRENEWNWDQVPSGYTPFYMYTTGIYPLFFVQRERDGYKEVGGDGFGMLLVPERHSSFFESVKSVRIMKAEGNDICAYDRPENLGKYVIFEVTPKPEEEDWEEEE
ncbi:MAG: hypothetical protein Q4A78_10025 [Peptostreptococcaceae bacterium]|nr:hypothetical protein [Peptostreptococcaceae bacterium]